MKIINGKYQKGFSLVEMMIALLIGSLVTGSILQLMVSYSESSRVNDYLVTGQENGRSSLYLLSHSVRMAGYRERFSYDPADLFYHGACEGDTTCTEDGGGTDSDRIAIQYEPLNGIDCAGLTVPAGGLTADVYYISADPNNNNTNALFCRGYDPVSETARGVGVVMVSGVERLQVIYGLMLPTEGEFVRQYSTAGAVTDWADVRSVKIGVLVSAGQDVRVFENISRTYNLLSSGDLSFTDQMPRYEYVTTVRPNNAGL